MRPLGEIDFPPRLRANDCEDPAAAATRSPSTFPSTKLRDEREQRIRDGLLPPTYRAMQSSLPEGKQSLDVIKQVLNSQISPSLKYPVDVSKTTATTPDAKSVVAIEPATGSDIDIDCGWCRIPHPMKVHRGGEDVHLISRAGGSTLLAVFDGVGGWAELGVDPAEYARRLSWLLEAEFVRGQHLLSTHNSPLLEFLSAAFKRMEAADVPGSCTVSAGLITPSGTLHVLNVGDSGLHVVRDGVSVFATHEQQHYFNCPFQLGKGSDDSPADADYYVLEDLAEDDYIVLATDGVWDNIFQAEMLGELDGGKSCEAIARRISELSHRHGRDHAYPSPFALNAKRHGMRYTGGKLDDVTVVVSRVVRNVAVTPEGSEVSAMDSSDGV